MRGLGKLLIVAVFAGWISPPGAYSQSAQQKGKGKSPPDLSGVWDHPGASRQTGTGPAYGDVRKGGGGIPRHVFSLEQPPMLPWAAQKFQEARKGRPGVFETGSPEIDPLINCFPPGPTRIYTLPRPFQIRQLSDVVLMIFEWDHWVRTIYTDGRGHPEGYPITWMGHSIGKWDGDTLVVDTVDIHPATWIDSAGHPHTESLRVVERFRRPKHDTLEITFTFDDPKAYSRPWTGQKVFQLMPPNYEVMEHVVCEDFLQLGKHR